MHASALTHFVFHMVQGLVEKGKHMGVIQRINNLLAILSKFDEIGRSKKAQLVADGRMSHI